MNTNAMFLQKEKQLNHKPDKAQEKTAFKMGATRNCAGKKRLSLASADVIVMDGFGILVHILWKKQFYHDGWCRLREIETPPYLFEQIL
ncbi:hypothetical protein AVEN_172380-1 [Araneus ventricosus]|uniref:Uncharacterized protein n=1 Tax=Araneus ventricosus TaxID=182803 RepID=A0A4Y2TIV3_ARAVE|nr:hypothetical protein AVEN_172380-1 [Araneus ventricosus]